MHLAPAMRWLCHDACLVAAERRPLLACKTSAGCTLDARTSHKHGMPALSCARLPGRKGNERARTCRATCSL